MPPPGSQLSFLSGSALSFPRRRRFANGWYTEIRHSKSLEMIPRPIRRALFPLTRPRLRLHAITYEMIPTVLGALKELSRSFRLRVVVLVRRRRGRNCRRRVVIGMMCVLLAFWRVLVADPVRWCFLCGCFFGISSRLPFLLFSIIAAV
jgi:hypothetical protein